MKAESIFNTEGNFFHHAYLVIGETDEIKGKILSLIKKEKKSESKGNPDFVYFDYQSMGIDESRAISSAQMKRPVNGEHNFFFVSFQTATNESQNSLLKIFEDPSPHNVFFVITPNEQALLPTLRSRLFKVQYEGEDKPTNDISKKFLNSSQSERIAIVKDIIERKDKKEVLDFLSNIEKTLHISWKKNKFEKQILLALKEIVKARDYVNDRASSLKLLLEHISLIIPQIV